MKKFKRLSIVPISWISIQFYLPKSNCNKNNKEYKEILRYLWRNYSKNNYTLRQGPREARSILFKKKTDAYDFKKKFNPDNWTTLVLMYN